MTPLICSRRRIDSVWLTSKPLSFLLKHTFLCHHSSFICPQVVKKTVRLFDFGTQHWCGMSSPLRAGQSHSCLCVFHWTFLLTWVCSSSSRQKALWISHFAFKLGPSRIKTGVHCISVNPSSRILYLVIRRVSICGPVMENSPTTGLSRKMNEWTNERVVPLLTLMTFSTPEEQIM